MSTEKQDRELEEIAIEMKQNSIITDPYFGKLTLNEYDYFECKAQWLNNNITLSLYAEEKDCDIQNLIKLAKDLWKSQKEWNFRSENYAVKMLKDDVWLNDGDISIDEFKSRISLYSIQISPNGDISFYYNDGDLFYGHDIEINGNMHEGFNNVSR